MARLARIVVPDCPHHVTQRGNHRQDVFVSSDDHRTYQSFLRDHCHRNRLRVLAWCLMSNHVHLVVIPPDAQAMAKALGHTHQDYARWFHLRQRQVGHLWQNRFHSCPLEERHLWDAIRYVELNPVRAGLVREAEAWPWSSAAAHIGGRDVTGLLDMGWWCARSEGRWWRTVLREGFLDAQIDARLREATRTGRPFGSVEFTRRLEQESGRSLAPKKRGPSPQAATSLQLSLGVS